MNARGTIRNGKVVLDDPHALPNGTEVEIRLAKKGKTATKPKKTKSTTKPRSLAERLANALGKAPGLPADAAANHDHYLYGTPKQP